MVGQITGRTDHRVDRIQGRLIGRLKYKFVDIAMGVDHGVGDASSSLLRILPFTLTFSHSELFI